MNKHAKKKWVAALRSGEYKQGQGTLVRSEFDDIPATYCCLGVALAELRPESITCKNFSEMVNPKDGGGYIADDLAIHFGIAYKDQQRLAQMNDDIGKDFNQIADWIEENL